MRASEKIPGMAVALEWKRMGPAREASPQGVNQWSAWDRFWDGSWYSVEYSWLRTSRWDEAHGWQELVEQIESQETTGNDRFFHRVATQSSLVVLSGKKGVLYRFDGKRWEKLTKPSPLIKECTNATVAMEPGGRIVLWGGHWGVRSKKANDTLFFEKGKWRRAKTKSPPPRDFTKIDIGRTICTWDSWLDALVRFCALDVGVLRGDVWQNHAPEHYELNHSRKGHLGRESDGGAVHDPRTKETLLVHWNQGVVRRFDLDRCDEIARFETRKEVGDYSFDEKTRSVWMNTTEGALRLDLAPAFEAAKAIGPRKRS